MKGEIMLYTDNRQNKIEVNDELINIINEVCEQSLKAEEMNVPYQISLLFVDNEEIREINREFILQLAQVFAYKHNEFCNN